MDRHACLALLLAAGCGSAPQLEEARSSLSRITNPSVPTADADSLAAGNAQLATAMHRQLTNAASGNVVFSPYGLSFNMAELREALGGDLKDGLDATMGFALPDAQLDPAFDALDLALTSRTGKTTSGTGAQIVSSSAVWSAMPAPSPYLDTLAQYYGAGVLLGADPGPAIASWQATLPGAPQPFALAGPCDFALASYVRLDAAWQTPFDPGLTRGGIFHRADGSTVTASMMSAIAVLAVATASPAAIEIPYDGGALSMLVVVPDDLAAFDAALTPAGLEQVLSRLQPQTVALTLPKLSFKTSASVLSAMQAIGLPLDSGHWQIWQSAEVSVDEAGTVAAATTVTSHTPASVIQAVPFAVDRPFAFFLRDRATGTVVFSGAVVDPTAP